MADPYPDVVSDRDRANQIRLRTLILLRWIAIAGQIGAVAAAQTLIGLDLPLGPIYATIGASVIANVILGFVFPQNRRLTEREAMLALLFDLTQLSVLLYLTGGLNNPFALLIIAPVTISASALSLPSTIALGSFGIAAITLLAFFHLPLVTATGTALVLPELFLSGFWLAIVIALVFLSAYARRVTGEINSMQDALAATQLALAREQKLTDLGGVVAAAAHELGTPLATIKLAASELREELDGAPELAEDARLIGEQADRCRDILRSMGRAGKDDLHLRRAPLSAVLEEAAQPHADRGIDIHYSVQPGDGASPEQPAVLRRPEVIHGLRNLVQNAVDFALGQVWIDASWTDTAVTVRIIDDGPGFPPHVLGRIGDPFMRSRSDGRRQRQGYEGMGLGLFIAKTLLERSGAELSFDNGHDPARAREPSAGRSGAIVEVAWPREVIAPPPPEGAAGLGQNRPITG